MMPIPARIIKNYGFLYLRKYRYTLSKIEKQIPNAVCLESNVAQDKTAGGHLYHYLTLQERRLAATAINFYS